MRVRITGLVSTLSSWTMNICIELYALYDYLGVHNIKFFL